MNRMIAVATVTAGLLGLGTAHADAKGCIKGAIVGGVAGHMAGHGMMGAMGGCAVGHHMAKTKARKDAQGMGAVSGTSTTR